jgi:hypothetical protein
VAYGSREEFSAKINWEGGYWGAVEYGLKADDAPEGDEELKRLWQELINSHTSCEFIANKLDELFNAE